MYFDSELSTQQLIAINSIKWVGPKTILKILKANLSFDDLLNFNEEDLAEYIPQKAINEIINNLEKNEEAAGDQIDYYADKGITVVSILDDNHYPDYFRLINDPPILLYIRGNSSLLQHQNSIAIIGTRNCTPQGDKIARKTASYFAEKKYNIVSGLAVGIDTAAHKGALDAAGATTAVLVSINNILPEVNRDLADEIENNNGLLISENGPEVTFISKGEFVKRDRLQSALSIGVFPIETDRKGGTMHTVGFAEEQKRSLFCPDINKIPAYSHNNYSRGISMLLNEKRAEAYDINSYDAVISDLNKNKEYLNQKINTMKKQPNKPSEGDPKLFNN